MNINISPAQAGLIVKALENEIQKGSSDALNLSMDICTDVKEHFSSLPFGEELFNQWFEEWTELADFCKP